MACSFDHIISIQQCMGNLLVLCKNVFSKNQPSKKMVLKNTPCIGPHNRLPYSESVSAICNNDILFYTVRLASISVIVARDNVKSLITAENSLIKR